MNNFWRSTPRLIIVFFIGSLSSLAQEVESSKYAKMLERRLPKGVPVIGVDEVDTTDQTIVFLDARQREEYDVSHIENAYFIGFKNANLDHLDSLSKSTQIIVYCSIGYRSGKIAQQLINKGLKCKKSIRRIVRVEQSRNAFSR